MVEFKRLFISPDGKTLIIKAAVKEEEYYDDVYIESVTIDTQDTFTSSGPSNNPIFYRTFTDAKKVTVKLCQAELTDDLNKDLFFVYVSVSGIPAADTPCGLDCIHTLGVVFNRFPMYQIGLNYTKEIAEDCGECRISQNFIDFVLRMQAFQIALKTGHYTEAINFWKKYIYKEISATTTKTFKTSGCGCTG